ncbi:desampylase [Halobellus sp. GM3]|uniref:desampylase n=1 Tax=Halobellus sp. GM3 TaxID=3458410 RepID=UPI00403E0C32
MLTLRRDAYDDLVSRGVEGGSEEVCGVLIGEYGDEESRVTELRPIANAADAPEIRYAMDPAELLGVLDRVDADGLDVVGFYHSHPAGPPAPSETDAAEATWTDYSYAICALGGRPFLGSWRWRGEGFEPEVVALE